MLIHFGITPYMVFDGDNLPSKSGTEKDRRSRRKESKKAGLELLRLGKTSQAHQELQKSVDVTAEMARMLIEELKRAHVQYVVAPYEADSQLVYLERKGIIQGILSEDSDLLVFGARNLITKLDQYGECILIRRDDFTACREVSLVGWSDADFRRMAILSGCDYLPNISKMGLKTAYRLIRKHKTVEKVIRAIQFDGQFKVPPTYLDDFVRAENTFLYQWVFCPEANQLVNFSVPSADIDVSQLAYIGAHIDPEVSRGVAKGDLHPTSKQPIELPKSTSFPRRSLGAPKAAAMTTPDLKRTKSIDSFFRAKRTPLAELDPNCFAPSPSQRQLLERTPLSWVADVVPANALLNRTESRPQPYPSLQRPSPARRAILGSPTLRRSTEQPSKRRRLCADPPDPLPSSSIRVETGSSRFFSPTNKPSPSQRSSKNPAKAELNLWSDDSIEDAMAELSDPVEPPTSTKKKFAVFEDSAPPSPSVGGLVQSPKPPIPQFKTPVKSAVRSDHSCTAAPSTDLEGPSSCQSKSAPEPTSITPTVQKSPDTRKSTLDLQEAAESESHDSHEASLDRSQSHNTPKLAASISDLRPTPVHGSEDFIIPDSEEEEEEAPETPGARLDLSRFMFAGAP